MDREERVTHCKRTERVKSIFDSDDSDENSDKGFSPSKDEDDDDDLRKQIDEVCFNLSNEEEKLMITEDVDICLKEKVKDLNILTPTFTMEEVTGAKSSLIPHVAETEDAVDSLPCSSAKMLATTSKDFGDTDEVEIDNNCDTKDNDMVEADTDQKYIDDDDVDRPIVAAYEERDIEDDVDRPTVTSYEERDVKEKENMESSVGSFKFVEKEETAHSEGIKPLTQYMSEEKEAAEESENIPVDTGMSDENVPLNIPHYRPIDNDVDRTINASFQKNDNLPVHKSETLSDREMSVLEDKITSDESTHLETKEFGSEGKCSERTENVRRKDTFDSYQFEPSMSDGSEKDEYELQKKDRESNKVEEEDKGMETSVDIKETEEMKEKASDSYFFDSENKKLTEVDENSDNDSLQAECDEGMDIVSEANVEDTDIQKTKYEEEMGIVTEADVEDTDMQESIYDEGGIVTEANVEDTDIQETKCEEKIGIVTEADVEDTDVQESECEEKMGIVTEADVEDSDIQESECDGGIVAEEDVEDTNIQDTECDEGGIVTEEDAEDTNIQDTECDEGGIVTEEDAEDVNIQDTGNECDELGNITEDVEDTNIQETEEEMVILTEADVGDTDIPNVECDEEMVIETDNPTEVELSKDMHIEDHPLEDQGEKVTCKNDDDLFDQLKDLQHVINLPIDEITEGTKELDVIPSSSLFDNKNEMDTGTGNAEDNSDILQADQPSEHIEDTAGHSTDLDFKEADQPSEHIEDTVGHNTDLDIKEEKIEIDNEVMEDGNENEHKERRDELSKSPSKDAELANLNDVWNAVNIFHGPKLVPLSEVEIVGDVPNKASETSFNESDNDSGMDLTDKVVPSTEHKQSLQDTAGKKVITGEEDMETDELATHVTKETNSSPWEAMKNGSLFEDVQMLQDQSPEYLSAESLKRKKVRVEDIFTDSEGEDREKQLQKLKILAQEAIEPAKEDATTVKRIRRKREKATSINLPAIMLAFEKGWIREVVYRSSAGIGSKKADIYYYSPDHRKLRSRVELEEYLTKNNVTDLTMQNFSFFKEPLGVEQRYEVIRLATSLPKQEKGEQTAIQALSEALGRETVIEKPVPKKRVRKPTPKVQDQPPAKKAKTKEVVKKVVIKDTPGKAAAPQAKKKPLLQPSKVYYPMQNADSAVYATHLYPANPPLTQARIITPVIRGEAKDRTFHCTATCEAGGGNVPNLQCVKCVCLFHPECCQMPSQTVSLILSAIAKFLCPNCYSEENLTRADAEAEFSPAPCFEPLAFDPASESEDEGMVSDYEHPSFKRFTGRPPTPELPPLSPLDSANKYSSIRSSNLNVPLLPQTPALIPPSAVFPQQSQQVPQLIPNLPLAVPLPPSSTIAPNSYLIYQPVNAKSQNIPQPMYLPPGATPPTSVAYNVQPPTQVPPTIISQSLAAPPAKKAPQPPKESPKKLPTVPVIVPGVSGGEHFLKDMASAYILVRRVFAYLSLSDLLQVSRVCVMWRDVAFNHCFWNSIRLKNICVNDWDKLVEFLDRRGTTVIDLRDTVICPGMLYQKKKSLKCAEGNQTENVTTDLTVKEDETIAEDDVVESDAKEMSESPKKKMETSKDEEDNEEKMAECEVNENEKKDHSESMNDKEILINVEEETVEKMEVDETEEEKEESMKKIERELEEERLEKEKREKMSYIVSSVLSEHDYFGRPQSPHDSSFNRTRSSSSSSSSGSDSSSSSCSSSSDGSEAGDPPPLDGSEIDVEGMTIEDDLEKSHLKDDLEKSHQNTEENVSTPSLPPVAEEAPKPSTLDPPAEKQDNLGTTQEAGEKPPSEGIISPRRSERKTKAQAARETRRISETRRLSESRRISETLKDEERELTEEESIVREWRIIASSLGKMRSLCKLTVGTVSPTVGESFLLKCHQLTSFSSLNLGCQAEDTISFDPSLLMQTRSVEELRLTSQKRLTFKSNFNFIKLPHLKVLMLKGLKTTDIGWPYMGTQLTNLYLSSVSTFSHHNWLNVSSMTGLIELELDGGGSDHDTELCLALTKLTSLNRLALLDWNIGPKLPYTLRKLHNIKYLHVVPSCENQTMRGIYAGRLMVVLEAAKHLVEFTWGIQPQSVVVDESAGDKVHILNMKGGKETGAAEGEEVRSIAIDSLKGFIRCRIPNTKINVRRVSSNPWTWTSSDWQ